MSAFQDRDAPGGDWEGPRRTGKQLFMVAALFLGFVVTAFAAEEKPAGNVTAGKRIRLSGNLNFRVSAEDPGRNGFSVSKARLSVSGELFKNATFKFQVEAITTPHVLDAQMDIAFHKMAAVSLGQFKVPFSQENIYTDTDLDTIKRSQPVVAMCPGYDTDSSGRDIGMVFYGTHSILEYTVGIFNGEGINKPPTNKPKDLAGRLRLNPAAFLAIGVSYYKGTAGATADAPVGRRDRAGVEMTLGTGAFSLKGEYIKAWDEDLDRHGWYLQVSHFLVAKRFQGVLKVDSYNPNIDIPGSRSNLWTVGINWFIAPRTKLQVNYGCYLNEAGRTTKRSLIVQLRGGF